MFSVSQVVIANRMYTYSIYLASQLMFSLEQKRLGKIKQFKKLDRPSKKFQSFPYLCEDVTNSWLNDKLP